MRPDCPLMKGFEQDFGVRPLLFCIVSTPPSNSAVRALGHISIAQHDSCRVQGRSRGRACSS